jgi:hypothetical protein
MGYFGGESVLSGHRGTGVHEEPFCNLWQGKSLERDNNYFQYLDSDFMEFVNRFKAGTLEFGTSHNSASFKNRASTLQGQEVHIEMIFESRHQSKKFYE